MVLKTDSRFLIRIKNNAGHYGWKVPDIFDRQGLYFYHAGDGIHTVYFCRHSFQRRGAADGLVMIPQK